ncbi:MAG: hypothetical protein HHJ16_04860 [Polaromonas sp.]|uniref:hypothetical protein n=1 Tax=Polaromonas sp. TaxID=1869339 RepID=UPI0017CBD5C1|nr:hypothetical protein [Polaromonas sp.]NMM09584.1 hypothetical protein [Polaromonas sp.]
MIKPISVVFRPRAASQAGAGKGLAVKSPPANRTGTLQNASVDVSLQLPHERDQSVDMTARETSSVVEQARRDLAKGLQDTSKGAEMDAAYKKLAP